MQRFKSLSVVTAIIILASASFAAPVHLRCEYLENPLGIDAATPHLSSQSDNTERNWKQSAYEILVASDEANLRPSKADVWDSGKVDSTESIGIAYARFAAGIAAEVLLESPCVGRSRSSFGADRNRVVGDGPAPARRTGKQNGFIGKITKMTPTAKAFAGYGYPVRMHSRSCRRTIATFRVTVKLPETARDAVLLLATRGDFVATVNGHEVDGKRRWTTFDRRDISDQLIVGENTIEITVTAPAPRGGRTRGRGKNHKPRWQRS